MTYWYMVAYFASGCLGHRVIATDYNALTPVGIHRLIEDMRNNGEEIIILNVVRLNGGGDPKVMSE